MKYLIIFAMSVLSLQALPPYQIWSPCPNGNLQSVTIIDADQNGEYDTVHFVDCEGKEDITRIGLMSPSQETDFIGSDSVDVDLEQNTNGNFFIDVKVYDSGTPILKIVKGYADTSVTFITLGVPSNKQINSNEDQPYLLIYPNPTFNKITLKNIPLNASFIKIFNLNGEVIISTLLKGENVIEMDITELSIGQYYIQIGNGTNSKIQNLTKIN